MRNSLLIRLKLLAVAATVGAALGCSNSNLGEVQGTVRLNGKPLSDATVTFTPREPKGSASTGKTNSSGHYVLYYAGGDLGAEIGEHVVRVTTFQQGDPDAATPLATCRERVPVQYNERSKLSKSIQAGENVIDIELNGAER